MKQYSPSSLSEPTFLILLSLAGGPRHGYAILKEVHSLSGGRVRLSTGTLFGAIKRLLDLGWIERSESMDEPSDGRTRIYYELTPRGRLALQAETERMEDLVHLARWITDGGTP